MQAASKKNNGHNVALRNQLLSTDIGNIDVRDEPPMNNPQMDSYPPLQQQQQQPYNNYPMSPGMGPGPMPQQRYNPPSQYINNNYNQQPVMPFAHPGQPRSRRSSLQSNNSSFNMASMNNFFKMNKSKSKFSGGGDDDDEEGKDVMIDDTGNTMSFDDISTLKDRGRYGGQSSFDSTPIIPTLQSSSSRPLNPNSMSNNQYRKQMTAFKKQVMMSAGKTNDSRAMSLQAGGPGRNPYQEANDPRAMSLQGNRNPYVADPRAMSLQGRNPYQDMNDPRTRSMTGQPHPYAGQPQQPRTNPLTAQQYQQSPRAYSLTTNPYQQQQQHPMQRPPMHSGFQAPHQQFTQPGLNHSPKFGSQAGIAGPQRNPPSGAPFPPNNQRPTSTQQQPSSQFQQKRPIPSGGDPNGFFAQKPSSNSFAGYNPSTPTIEETPSLHDGESQYRGLPNGSNNTAPISNQVPETSHHYLADNTLNNNDQLDDSGATYSDFSASNEKSFILPNDESTPSPERPNKKMLVDNHHQPDHKLADEEEFDGEETPSKLPRSKGLPHLSLLKIRDEDSDETIDEISAQDEPFHRSLDPVDENEDAQMFPNRNTATPPPISYDNLRRNSPVKASPSPVVTPGRKYVSPNKNMSPSPLKKLTNNSEIGTNGSNTHKRFPMSMSSMSEYSTFSGVSDGFDNTDLETKKKLYQLAGNSATTNDVFVTASQFSLMDNKNLDNNNNANQGQVSQINHMNGHPDTIVENDYSLDSDNTPKINDYDQGTPILEQQNRKSYDPSILSTNEANNLNKSSTTDSASIISSRSNTGSIRSSFKSPKFLQKWSRKRSEKKRNNSFEPVTQPVEVKTALPRETKTSPSRIIPPTRDLPAISKLGDEPSKGLHIMNGGNIYKGEQGVEEAASVKRKDSAPYQSQRLSPESHYRRNSDDRTITAQGAYQPVPDLTIDHTNNVASQPTSASGTYSSHSTNNTIDTELENDDLDHQDSKNKSIDENQNAKSMGDNATSLQKSFELKLPSSDSAPPIDKKLNLTVDQLGIMEEKSSIVRELELVSKELGDSIRREIKLEDQLKSKDIISSPNLNYDGELREKASFISQLEKQLIEERKKRYIAEEHVLLWENGSKPSALQLSYEIEKLQSELLNKDEVISKQLAEIESLEFDLPKNEDKVEVLTKANREFETVTIPSLKNEIEVLANDKKRLSAITEKFKLLKIENGELERRLQQSDEAKDLHSKQLEEELVQMKQKFEKRVNKSNEDDAKIPNTSVINNRLKKTVISELGTEDNSFDSFKPPSPMNGKRIASFSLINVTSPNEK